MERGFMINILPVAAKTVSRQVSAILNRLTGSMTAMNLTYLWTFVLRRKPFMFSNFFLKSFRILLLPFALLYWLGVGVRNWLYDKNIFDSTSFGLPVICIGNLSVGGTGKSPMVEWLVDHLQGKFKLATLSRGYKRKTKGYTLANPGSTA